MSFSRHKSGLWLPDEKPKYGEYDLNPYHPLAFGLVGAWILNEQGGGIAFDASENGNNAFITGPVWDGGGLKFSNSADELVCDNPVFSQTEGSFFCKLRRIASWDVYGALFNVETTGNDSTHELICFNSSGLQFYPNYDQSSGDKWVYGAVDTIFPLNTRKTIAGAWKNGSTLVGYIDGVQFGSLTGDASWIASAFTTEKCYIGNTGGGISLSSKSIIECFYVFDRALTAAEIQQLHAEPYAMFIPKLPIKRFYIEASGGINWITDIQGASITPDTVSKTITRALLTDISGSSTTPNIAVTLARALSTDVQGSSTTPSIGTIIVRGLITDIQGSSATSSIAAIIARALTADIQGSSTTPSVAATIARALSTDIQGTSVTPDDAVSSFTVFDCDWEDGSGILNTGGTYEWLSETDVDGKLSEASDSEMWNSDYLYWNGTSNNAGYLTKALSTFGESGYRFGLNCFSEGLATSEQQCIFRIQDSGSNALFNCYLYDNGSNLLIYFQVYDTGGTGRNTTAITLALDTNYQIVVKLKKNTAGGFYFSVYQEDGTTQVGSEIQLSTDYTTRNSNAFGMFAGTIFASAVTTEHGLDIIQVINSYDYPETVQVGAISWITNIIGSSTTPSIATTTARGLATDIQGSSTTSSISAIIARALLTDIQGASTTPSITSTLERALITDITGASTTSEITVNILRALITDILGSSVTPEINIIIEGTILWITNIIGSSVTPSISQTTERALFTDIQGDSTTPSITAIIARAITTSIMGESTTAEATVNIIRALITNIIGSSITSDITAILEGAIFWIASIVGTSITPEVSVDLIRGLQTNIQGQSITPDDVSAIWNEILSVVDSTITSLTPIKTMESITPIRTIEEI